MDKIKKLKKILEKASSLEKNSSFAIAEEFSDIHDKVDLLKEDIDTISNTVDEKLGNISEELKKKLEEELNYEIDPEEIRGEQGIQGERGEQGEKGDKGEPGRDGKDGKDGRDGLDGKDGLDGQNGLPGANGSPDTGEEIVNKINELPTDDSDKKIDASHIKNLPEAVKYYGGSGIKEVIAGDGITVDNSNLGYPVVTNTLDLSDYAKNAIEITVANLDTAIANSTLITEQWYLITDYATTDYIRQASSSDVADIPIYYTAPTEQIYVQASSVNTIYYKGYSKTYPGEEIGYQATRTNPTLTPEFEYYGGNNYPLEVTPIDQDTLEFTTNPYPINHNDVEVTTFDLYAEDYTNGTNHDFTWAEKGTVWDFDVSGNFVILQNNFIKNSEIGVEWSTADGNMGSQEVSINSDTEIEATSPETDFNNFVFTSDGYSYFYIADYDSGATKYFDYANKDQTWEIDGSGLIQILDQGNDIYLDSYYEAGVGNSGTYDIIIDSATDFSIDVSDVNLQKGTIYNGVSAFFITWTDGYEEFQWSDYGTKWTCSGNVVTLIGNSHDLTNNLVILESYLWGSDQTSLVQILSSPDAYLYMGLYAYGVIDLIGDTYILGYYTYTSAELGGLIINRTLPEYEVDIDVDYRGTKFRRYAISSSILAWNSGTAYVAGDFCTYGNSVFYALNANTNKTPSGNYFQYWIKLATNINSYPYFLPRTGYQTIVKNQLVEGQVTGVTLSSGGSGYTPGTVTLTLCSGDHTCTLSCTANGSGVITSIDSILTPGIGYPMYSKSGSNISTNRRTSCETGGSGCTVNITSISSDSQALTLSPDLTSYYDFNMFISDPTTFQNVSIKKGTDTSELDIAFISSYTLQTVNIIYTSGCNSIRTLYYTDISLTENNYIVSMSYSEIDLLNNCIVVSMQYVVAKDFSYSIFVDVSRFSIIRVYYCIIGVLTNSKGTSWIDTCFVPYSGSTTFCNNNTINIMEKCYLPGSYLNNLFNDLYHVNFSASRTGENSMTGTMQRCYFSSTFNNNSGITEFFYFTALSNVDGNNFFNIVGVSGPQQPTYQNPVCVYSFTNNTISGPFYNFYTKRIGITTNRFYGTVYNIFYPSLTFNSGQGIKYNTFYSNFSETTFLDNYSDLQHNQFYGSFSYNYFNATGYTKSITYSIFYGYCSGLVHNGGIITKLTVYGDMGHASLVARRNTFTGGSNSKTLIDTTSFGGGFYGNTFTEGVTYSTFGIECQSNTFSQGITNTTIGSAFKTNTFTGSLSNVILGSNISGTAFATTQNTVSIGQASVLPYSSIQLGSTTSIGFSKGSTNNNYTLGINNYTMTMTVAEKTFTLPTAVGCTGRVYNMINASGGNMFVTTTSKQTINGQCQIPISSGGSISVVSNNTEWEVLSISGNQISYEDEAVFANGDMVFY